MPREIRTHKIPGQDHSQKLYIAVADLRGSGNANHEYDIITHDTDNEEGFKKLCTINFQNGPVQEVGVNGISNEALLAIVVDRLQCFQDGDFRCRENALALTKIEEAMLWLSKRSLDRLARGVEGKNIK